MGCILVSAHFSVSIVTFSVESLTLVNQLIYLTSFHKVEALAYLCLREHHEILAVMDQLIQKTMLNLVL